MTAPARAALYSRDLLGLAVELAGYPHDPGASVHGEARSRSCGSTIALSASEGMQDIGLKVAACAVGQASAAIFAAAAQGKSLAEIDAAAAAIAQWLAGEGTAPDWPRIEMLAPALPYHGRHEAILLPWRAASAALSKGQAGR